MMTILKAETMQDMEKTAAMAYNGTMDADGTHRGFHSAEIHAMGGNLECRATPCASNRKASGIWFSFRYYLNGSPIKKPAAAFA